MRILIALTVLVLLGVPAYAGGCKGNCPQGGKAVAKSSSKSTAVGVGVGVGKANAASNSGGNSITVQGDTFKRSARAPDVVLGVGNCIATVGGSLGLVGFSGGAGVAEEQKRCTIMYAADRLAAWGERENALKLIHGIDWVKEILEPKAAKQTASASGPSVVYQGGKRLK